MALFSDEYKVPGAVPVLAAAMAATFKVSCSLFLIAGLATRVAALPLLAQIFVIQTFVYPNAWPEHLVWSSILLVLLTRGGGAASLDHPDPLVVGGPPRRFGLLRGAAWRPLRWSRRGPDRASRGPVP